MGRHIFTRKCFSRDLRLGPRLSPRVGGRPLAAGNGRGDRKVDGEGVAVDLK